MKYFLALFIAALLCSCSHATLVFDQTCVTCIKSQRLSCTGQDCPSTFMIDTNSVVTMVETGENIYVNGILWGEGMRPTQGVQLAIAKIDGRYYMTGESFKNLWVITPEPDKGNQAAYEPIPLPKPSSISKPVFELFSNRLMLSAGNYEDTKYLLNAEDKKWEIFRTTPTKGE